MSHESRSNRPTSNRRTQNEWQRRITRAEELGAIYSFASEILRFYVAIARFQESFYAELGKSLRGASVKAKEGPTRTSSTAAIDRALDCGSLAQPLPPELAEPFLSFLIMVERNGPEAVQRAARELQGRGEHCHAQLLADFWNGSEAGGLQGTDDFFARAFLQPYAVGIRLQSERSWNGPPPYLCPFCKRKPGLGVLRPLGDGGQRSLVCSFCLAEWEFRRLVCPACGEENHAKLPIYTAEDLKHVRVEGCDSCRSYIKTVDMTKSGLAEPIVDEMASIPLDLWARNQGYAKLQLNMLQL